MAQRLDRQFSHRWHVAINRFNFGPPAQAEHRHWMYEAKAAADEVPRLAKLFESERTGALPKIHRQCSQSEPEPIVENVLTCCLGVKCAACPELLAIGSIEGSLEEIDTAKAWTCVAHILSKGGDWGGEGYVLTTDDRMYWDCVYHSLAATEQP